MLCSLPHPSRAALALLAGAALLAGLAACAPSQEAASPPAASPEAPAEAPGYQGAGDAAVETDFAERYRPQYHFSPRQNWMNDPNGLVYHDGTYHLFFQHNPFGKTWGHMSWGHATSTDLVHWEHQPVAIPEEGDEMIFSGSAVVDEQNTSGFGAAGSAGTPRAPMVAIYTSHYDRPQTEKGYDQAQSLAYSADGGETWTKYAGNPVLEDAEHPDFRDPKVFWYAPEEKWVMVVALPEAHKIRFYESQDLKAWTQTGEFGPAAATGGVWECPDLFELPVDGDPGNTRWVLDVDLNPGGVAGGSGGQYFIGTFDGDTFTEDASTRPRGEPLWVDYGTDFYATITWDNVPSGRRLWVGWMNNWNYGEALPTAPWRSAQSVPRALALRTVGGQPRLVQTPAEELEPLRRNARRLGERTVADGEQALPGVAGKALDLRLTLDPGGAAQAGLKVRAGGGQETAIGYDAAAGTVFLDRTNAGEDDFSDEFAKRMEAPIALGSDGQLDLRVLVDWSSVEVFAEDGARVLTARIFPDPESQGVRFFAEGGPARLLSLEAWDMASVWDQQR